MSKNKETIVIGAGLVGLTTAYALNQFGYSVTLIEKSDTIGGFSGSFKNRLGHYFDYGYHALDYNRSVFTTKFFEKILGEDLNKVLLKRGIVLRNHLIDYNLPEKDWPESIRRLFVESNTDQTVGIPTRSELNRIYGPDFVNLIYDEVIPSYRGHKWLRDNEGLNESGLHLAYPWFFPSRKRDHKRSEEWFSYHDKVRETNSQYVLYSKEKGFGNLLGRMENLLNSEKYELFKSVGDLKIKIDQKNKRISSISFGDYEFTSDLIFWASPIGGLCSYFNVSLPKALKPQEFRLGSFAFSKPLGTQYHEILVGDLNHKIDRISFPSRLSGKSDNLVQVEFFYPQGELNLDQNEWKNEWLNSLEVLKIIDGDNELIDFDFKALKRGFVTSTPYQEIIELCKAELSHPSSNLYVPFWGVGPENINRLIPTVFSSVLNIICSKGN